jgi:glycosyltransferase involved in cell wall biosynthesis
MRRMNLVCLTSDHEGMPNVVLEAMALARPVVATRVGGVPEVVKDGVSGFLVEPGDVEGVAHRVMYLLSNPDLSKKMGLAGQEIVLHNFTCEEAVQRFTNLYSVAVCEKDVAYQ